jgi:formiminotetrahydrofolate cyclodeaminase
MSEKVKASLVERSVALSQRLRSQEGEPPGGAVAALVAAWAAELAAAAADRSREGWDEAAGARAQAGALRERALSLVERETRAHAQAMATLAARGRQGQQDREEMRDWRLGEAVRLAAEPPLELAACALDVAELAQVVAAHAAGEVRADAAVAAQLAAAAARAGAHLVEINLVVGGDRQPAVQARALADAASSTAAKASDLD